MEKKLCLALRDGIAVMSPKGEMLCRTHMDGVLALCAGKDDLYCADRTGSIWRFDCDTLMPRMLSCGGPGICAMCLSPGEERLYALVGEGDSVLMSDAKCGSPLAVNRCGCNPKSLVCCADVLSAAGGETCCAYLYCTKTLARMQTYHLPGHAYSAIYANGVLYALCLTQDMNSLLIAFQGRRRKTIPLPGFPGCLQIDGNRLYAATQGWIYRYPLTGDRRLRAAAAPGRADRLIVSPTGIFMHDQLSECVFASNDEHDWSVFCGGVRDICII